MWITDVIRKVVRRLFPVNVLEQKLNIRIASSSAMERAISEWRQMYRNEAWWLGGDSDVRSQNLPATIANEFARLILTEFSFEMEGSERAEYIGEQLQKFLIHDISNRMEYWCADGGVVMKPFVVDSDSEEDSEEDRPAIRIDYIGADRFYPTAFDSNGEITGAIFIETKLIDHKLYTRVEYHNLKGKHYTITNMAFVTEKMDGDISTGMTAENQFNEEVPLDAVPEWAGISPVVEMENIRRPFFVYVKTPMANNIDPDSPLGVSVYSRAVDVIMESDKQYSRTLWEYEAKEAAIDADADLFKKDVNGNPILPEGKERLFRTYDFDNPTGKTEAIKAYSPEIRDASMLNEQEALLRKIEFLVGLAYGTISNPTFVDKTATEVLASKQRSFTVVRRMQQAWDEAFDSVIDIMDMLCDLYEIIPAGPIEKTCTWGDGVLEDLDKEYTRRWQMVASNKLKPEKFLAWYFGCSEEEAAEMMPQIEEFPAYE